MPKIKKDELNSPSQLINYDLGVQENVASNHYMQLNLLNKQQR